MNHLAQWDATIEREWLLWQRYQRNHRWVVLLTTLMAIFSVGSCSLDVVVLIKLDSLLVQEGLAFRNVSEMMWGPLELSKQYSGVEMSVVKQLYKLTMHAAFAVLWLLIAVALHWSHRRRKSLWNAIQRSNNGMGNVPPRTSSGQ